MAFNGDEGQQISLSDASSWTANYRNSSGDDGVHAQFYGKNKLKNIVNQTGCVGIRIYKGIDSQGVPVLILVGTDADENDMTSGYILERGVPCPPYCGSGGLNG